MTAIKSALTVLCFLGLATAGIIHSDSQPERVVLLTDVQLWVGWLNYTKVNYDFVAIHVSDRAPGRKYIVYRSPHLNVETPFLEELHDIGSGYVILPVKRDGLTPDQTLEVRIFALGETQSDAKAPYVGPVKVSELKRATCASLGADCGGGRRRTVRP